LSYFLNLHGHGGKAGKKTDQDKTALLDNTHRGVKSTYGMPFIIPVDDLDFTRQQIIKCITKIMMGKKNIQKSYFS
jgi:hypothetical protein